MSSGLMSSGWADTVGLAGSAIMIVAYAYSNVARTLNLLLFNILNLIGAILLIASLTVHFNLASMLLEVVWAAIALLGFGKALLARRHA